MNIYEFADVIDREIIIKRHSNQDDKFTACFYNAETKITKGDGILSSCFGIGHTPEQAINDYVKEIQGKLLILDAMSDNRQQYVVPNTLAGI